MIAPFSQNFTRTRTTAVARRPPAWRRRIVALTVMLTVLMQASCGEALVASGLIPKPKVFAEFKLTPGPIVVLVDDFQDLCYWPGAADMLADKVAEQLKDHNAAKIIIPQARVRHVKQSHSEFDEMSCAAIGRLVEAEQLILLEVQSFDASESPVEATASARMGVSVKVINVLEDKDPSSVRLWPRSRQGHPVEVELTAEKVIRAANQQEILKELTGALAAQVARCFYDRRMDDFEKE